MEHIFSEFWAYDFQITFQSATQSFKLENDFSECRLERVKFRITCEVFNIKIQ